MASIQPVIGEQYRFSPDPYYGIGTVESVSTKDRTGTMVSEECGLIYFNDFELVSVDVDSEQLVDDSVACILAEIKMLVKDKVLPQRGVKSFAELHDYFDANVLILKHVPRDSDWIDASDDVREAQAALDNLVMDRVSKELGA